jgi:hypothetical protein
MNDAPLPLAIIYDLDGTLALLNGRSPYDASLCLDDGLNVSVAHIVRTYAEADESSLATVSRVAGVGCGTSARNRSFGAQCLRPIY